jgi:Iap family predicted aminopeptidase
MKRLVWLLIPLCLLLLLIPATALATPSFDKAVDQLVGKGYPQHIEDYLNSLGTNPDLGFRWAGTSADNAAATFLAREMKAMGLKHVRLEPVPVDVFEFKHADVTVGDKVMMASTFIGVPPTPANGITAPVVYVGQGTAADFLTAGDVTGKLVLIDMAMSSWWLNQPAWEAWLNGAVGVILTTSPADTSYYSVSLDALGSFDGYYDINAPPLVYISQRNADWLKGQLTVGAVTATMTLNEDVKLAKNGGVGYNVVGELPGRSKDGQMVVMAAHHDAHFRAGLDDTGAVANLMMIAKAMRSSGYKPEHTIVFLGTTGEEGGYTNAYYDWLTGAWWAITHAHPDWAGRVRAMINLELMAQAGGALSGTSTQEFAPWLNQLIADATPDLLPWGGNVSAPVYDWNDSWTFAAAGVPSFVFSAGGPDFHPRYHTQFETSAFMDYDYLGKIAKFLFRTERGVDAGLLPYRLSERDDLAATIDKNELLTAGAKPRLVNRLVADVTAFTAAADAYDARSASIPVWRIPRVNEKLLRVEKTINHNLTAITPFDPTIYPHQQVLKDTKGLQAAIAALQLPTPDATAALKALGGVYLTWYGINFSHPVYRMEIRHHDPDYYRITWGGQGQLPEPLDVMDEYHMIEAGDYAGAIAGLSAKLGPQTRELNGRLERIACTLETVTPQINDLH